VGTLKAAKKRGELHFKGHMLLMPAHANVRIALGATVDEDDEDDEIAAKASRPALASSTSSPVPSSVSAAVRQRLIELAAKEAALEARLVRPCPCLCVRGGGGGSCHSRLGGAVDGC